mgnify:CR=1 FL=1
MSGCCAGAVRHRRRKHSSRLRTRKQGSQQIIAKSGPVISSLTHTFDSYPAHPQPHAQDALLLLLRARTLPQMLPRQVARTAVKLPLPKTSQPSALRNGTIAQTARPATPTSTSSTLHLRRPRPRWLSSGPLKGDAEQEGPPREKQPSFSFSGALGGRKEGEREGGVCGGKGGRGGLCAEERRNMEGIV